MLALAGFGATVIAPSLCVTAMLDTADNLLPLEPRMRLSRRPLLAAVLCLPWLAWGQALTTAAAPAWPTKAVRIVVPFAAGGTTDILARALAPELQQAFGQPFVIENKPGAGGNNGALEVAKAAQSATVVEK